MKHKRTPHRFLTQISLIAFLLATMPLALAEPGGKTPVALCDADTGSPGGGGVGAPIYGWPEKGSGEYPKAVSSYVQERKERVMGEHSRVHRQYSDAAGISIPDLRASMNAREQFFELTYGKNGAIIAICEARRELGTHLDAYAKALTASSEANACAGAVETMQKSQQKAGEVYAQYTGGIDKALKGFVDPKTKKKVNGLEHSFDTYRRINHTVNENGKSSTPSLDPAVKEALDLEFDHLWGHGASKKKAFKIGQMDAGGIYSETVAQTQREKSKAEEARMKLEEYKKKLAETQTKCKSITEEAKKKEKGETKEATKPGGKAVTPAASRASPEKAAAMTPATERPAPGDVDESGRTRESADDDTRTRPDPERRPGNERRTASDDQTRRTSDDTEPPPPPKPAKEKGTSNFLKDNWMWLAGGAAVVGGGVYLYKEHKKEKKEERRDREFWEEMNRRPAYGPVNPDDEDEGEEEEGGGGVTAPQGSKLIITQVIGNVNKNETMPKIEVVVTDSAGLPVKINGLAIHVTCYAPQPCSLTGGQSVTTIDGRVSFESLKFTQAHTGVKLQFTASGMHAVTTQSPFDVLENGTGRE